MAVAVVIATPFIGDIRTWLMAQLGRRFVTVANSALLAAAILVVVATVARIRHRRAIRYGLLVAAAAIAWVYGQGAPGASAVTRAVERFHFFEYGLVTLLFVRAFAASGRADPATFVLAALAGLIVGTAEEAVQWFIPNRIGEIRDIFLNATAIAVGLLVALAIDPPRSFTWRVTPGARTAVAGVAALAVVLIALFIRVVHLGDLVADRDVAFHSRYSSAMLAELSAARAASWAAGTPPSRPATLSREDQVPHGGAVARAGAQRAMGRWRRGRGAWRGSNPGEVFRARARISVTAGHPRSALTPTGERALPDRGTSARPSACRSGTGHSRRSGPCRRRPRCPGRVRLAAQDLTIISSTLRTPALSASKEE